MPRLFLSELVNYTYMYLLALVRNYGIYYSLLLQVSAFVCVMALDARRQRDYRLECICCFKLDKATLPAIRYRDGLITMFMKRFWSAAILHKFVRPAIVSQGLLL